MSWNSWTRQQVELLIEEYKEHPILYSLKNKYYHNRKLRSVALNEILKKVKTIRPDTQVTDVLKKINGLRTNYVSERKKQLNSLKDLTSDAEIYQPSLWYYDLLSFLNANITPRDREKDLQELAKTESKTKVEEQIKMPATSPKPTKFLFLLLILLPTIRGQDDQQLEILKAEMEMAGLELQDDCENIANTYKTSLVTNTFNQKIKVREAHGELLKVHSKSFKSFEDVVPPELFRNWTFLVKPGDGLLHDRDWSSLVAYDTATDEFMHTVKVHCQNDTQNCVYIKKGHEHLLETSTNVTILKKSWYGWQLLLSSRKKQFPNVVNLVKKAAALNGEDGARSYWEMLTDQEGAYRLAEDCWKKIKPLYFKLQKFVKDRLFRVYNITERNEIPVYLLGSNFGADWSHIAGSVLPHPLIYQKAEAYINTKSIEAIYKVAEETTEELTLGPLGDKFWSKSLFNMTFCENNILTHCSSEYSELLTCNETSWVSYLNSHEVAIDVTLRNLASSQLDQRYSVIDESIKSLGSILAIKNMRNRGVWDQKLFSSESPHQMAELLLIALRVLPQLPFYLAADKWRLDLLENGFGKMEEKWWQYRKEYQRVEGIANNESDFLADSYITSNKPYLSKFLGTVLLFQFLNYYPQSWDEQDQGIASKFASDEKFLTMLRERSSYEWPTLLGNYYGIYDLSPSPLLEYFAPLNDYLKSAPLDQVQETTQTPTTTTSSTTLESTTVQKHQAKNLHTKVKDVDDVESGTHSIHHIHIEENLEGPNPTMEKISMYIGLCLVGGVAAIIVFFIISKKMAKRKRTNNRRFET